MWINYETSKILEKLIDKIGRGRKLEFDTGV